MRRQKAEVRERTPPRPTGEPRAHGSGRISGPHHSTATVARFTKMEATRLSPDRADSVLRPLELTKPCSRPQRRRRPSSAWSVRRRAATANPLVPLHLMRIGSAGSGLCLRRALVPPCFVIAIAITGSSWPSPTRPGRSDRARLLIEHRPNSSSRAPRPCFSPTALSGCLCRVPRALSSARLGSRVAHLSRHPYVRHAWRRSSAASRLALPST